jgi:hypothetical protein
MAGMHPVLLGEHHRAVGKGMSLPHVIGDTSMIEHIAAQPLLRYRVVCKDDRRELAEIAGIDQSSCRVDTRKRGERDRGHGGFIEDHQVIGQLGEQLRRGEPCQRAADNLRCSRQTILFNL